jgi:tRNA-specific 2-thiouridylase
MLDWYIKKIQSYFAPNSKIMVAMSGGVDSSVAAALIKRAGFDTIGITLQLYKSEKVAGSKTCCSGVDIQDAKQVAQSENFPHYVLDYSQIFKEKVIDDFVNTYEDGATPIPCGRCNQFIKFGDLLDFANTMEMDYLVTGHYVEKQKINDEECLLRGNDISKDQSYFLALTNKKQLKKLQFPLATINKTEVRKIANEIGLVVAKKQESQDICFIPDGDYKSFLRKIRPEMFIKGKIVNTAGELMGEHEGLADYTVGQRKGLNLNNGPWYVNKLDTKNNTLIIGRYEDLKHLRFKVEELNILSKEEEFEEEIDLQIRSTQKPSPGVLDIKTGIVTLLEPQISITPGQICAFYKKNRLIGGGIIEKIIED